MTDTASEGFNKILFALGDSYRLCRYQWHQDRISTCGGVVHTDFDTASKVQACPRAKASVRLQGV